MLKTITLVASLFVTSSAFADSLVTCQTTTRTPVKVVEYLIKSSASKRLNSPVFNTTGASVIVHNQSEVAQFVANPRSLYFLIDDANEAPVLSLSASLSNSKLTGTVSNYNSSGAISKNTKVVCRIQAL